MTEPAVHPSRALTWVDTHCHLFFTDRNPQRLIERASRAGVEWLVVPGIDEATSVAARDLALRFPDMALWTAGLHPHEASRWPEAGDVIAGLAADAAAVGECGLDYYRNLSPRDEQRIAFRHQLELAAALGKPVIIHCRDAFADVHAELEAIQLGELAVLHCWTGGTRWTKRFAELGVTFSYAGPLTFDTGETVRLGAKHAPPDRTMVETDTPYLTPPPHRHELNEPANVAIVGAVLAEVWGMDSAEVSSRTTGTARRIFGGPRS